MGGLLSAVGCRVEAQSGVPASVGEPAIFQGANRWGALAGLRGAISSAVLLGEKAIWSAGSDASAAGVGLLARWDVTGDNQAHRTLGQRVTRDSHSLGQRAGSGLLVRWGARDKPARLGSESG